MALLRLFDWQLLLLLLTHLLVGVEHASVESLQWLRFLIDLSIVLKARLLNRQLLLPVYIRWEIHITLRNLIQQWVRLRHVFVLIISLRGTLEVPRTMQTSLILRFLKLLVHGS
jgi:hypothetical protein